MPSWGQSIAKLYDAVEQCHKSGIAALVFRNGRQRSGRGHCTARRRRDGVLAAVTGAMDQAATDAAHLIDGSLRLIAREVTYPAGPAY